MTSQCVSCKNNVGVEDKAILCDLCEQWEHVACMKQSDRPSEALYEAMVSCRSKELLFSCTACRKEGSIVKQLMKHELDRARAEDEQLASPRAMGDLEKQLYQLREEIGKVTNERDKLRELVARLTSTPTLIVQVMGTVSQAKEAKQVTQPLVVPPVVQDEQSSQSFDDEDSVERSSVESNRDSNKPDSDSYVTACQSSVAEAATAISHYGWRIMKRDLRTVDGVMHSEQGGSRGSLQALQKPHGEGL